MTPGLVSIIVPVFNRPALLAEAVGSALAQTYRPIEILIVDDGSTDETPATAAQLASEHPAEIRVLRQVNAGPGSARERGRQTARGEFLQYLDSDDLLLPRKLELQVAALRAHAAVRDRLRQVPRDRIRRLGEATRSASIRPEDRADVSDLRRGEMVEHLDAALPCRALRTRRCLERAAPRGGLGVRCPRRCARAPTDLRSGSRRGGPQPRHWEPERRYDVGCRPARLAGSSAREHREECPASELEQGHSRDATPEPRALPTRSFLRRCRTHVLDSASAGVLDRGGRGARERDPRRPALPGCNEGRGCRTGRAWSTGVGSAEGFMEQGETRSGRDQRLNRLLIGDWLPPDRGAIGQYALLEAPRARRARRSRDGGGTVLVRRGRSGRMRRLGSPPCPANPASRLRQAALQSPRDMDGSDQHATGCCGMARASPRRRDSLHRKPALPDPLANTAEDFSARPSHLSAQRLPPRGADRRLAAGAVDAADAARLEPRFSAAASTALKSLAKTAVVG